MKEKRNQMDANLFAPSMEVFTSSGSEVCACATESNETRDIHCCALHGQEELGLTKVGIAPIPSGIAKAANRLNIFTKTALHFVNCLIWTRNENWPSSRH